ncbi:hypothetical protein J6P59_02670 [bacterium]|nr:hypothetical protein [bacterium]
MKKFIKILVGSFTAISVITSTIITPTEITKNISTSSNINGINIRTNLQSTIIEILIQICLKLIKIKVKISQI